MECRHLANHDNKVKGPVPTHWKLKYPCIFCNEIITKPKYTITVNGNNYMYVNYDDYLQITNRKLYHKLKQIVSRHIYDSLEKGDIEQFIWTAKDLEDKGKIYLENKDIEQQRFLIAKMTPYFLIKDLFNIVLQYIV